MYVLSVFYLFSGVKAELYDKTNPDWAPSLKLGPTEQDAEKTLSTQKRYERVQIREGKKSMAAKELDLQSESAPVMTDDFDESEHNRINCKFVLLGRLEKPLNRTTEEEPEITAKLRAEFQRLTTENMELKKRLSENNFTPESLEGDEEKTKHYTGLQFTTLMAIFHFLAPHITETSKSALTKFEKVMLVLIKLRLNLSLQDLGYRFNISTSCVSKTFQDIIHVMFVRLCLRNRKHICK